MLIEVVIKSGIKLYKIILFYFSFKRGFGVLGAKTHVHTAMANIVTTVVRAFRLNSDAVTSAPAATPMHAKHPLSTNQSLALPAADTAPKPWRPSAAPVSKYPVIFGVFAYRFSA